MGNQANKEIKGEGINAPELEAFKVFYAEMYSYEHNYKQKPYNDNEYNRIDEMADRLKMKIKREFRDEHKFADIEIDRAYHKRYIGSYLEYGDRALKNRSFPEPSYFVDQSCGFRYFSGDTSWEILPEKDPNQNFLYVLFFPFKLRNIETLFLFRFLDYQNIIYHDDFTEFLVLHLIEWESDGLISDKVIRLVKSWIKKEVSLENASSKSTTKITPTERKILFLTANPRDEQPLRLEGELRKVLDTLNGATHKKNFDSKIEPAVRIDIITKAMQTQNPEIVHFSGHGCIEGLAVEDYSGYSNLFPTEGLNRLFRLFRETTKCVILNACDSKELAKTISKHGIHVVGMNDEIGDEAARKFAVGFYQSLGEGNSYEFAFEMGMVHISNEYNDANTPELWFNGKRIRN